MFEEDDDDVSNKAAEGSSGEVAGATSEAVPTLVGWHGRWWVGAT